MVLPCFSISVPDPHLLLPMPIQLKNVSLSTTSRLLLGLAYPLVKSLGTTLLV
ncbi:hypothetical protein GIB67_002611 [Kingdonia uniflora]|uniref:Uncharacterized protein n=1 Tax=Kingdonia uniflora TaxID=39325 RepID=A0A7J7N4R2_9MAGN|nr:hypothetical protein GIB67_002611 [Kingdonia uniflora]